MKLRVYGIGLYILLAGIMTSCNLPSDANSTDLSLTSVAITDTASQSVANNLEETAEITITEEVDLPTVTPTSTSQPATSQAQVNLPTANTNSTCTKRTDWIVYTVKQGDTLGQIAGRVGSSTSELTQSNCLENANILTVGQQLYVPRQASPNTSSNSTVSNNTNSTTDENACRITITARTEIVNAPQGTGRTIFGYLDAGTIVIPTTQVKELGYFGFDYNGQIGWINAQPTGDCSRLPDVFDQQPNDNSCLIYVTSRTEVVDTPQGTGRTILGHLPAGSVVEPTIHFEGLSYYGFNFNGNTGWINVSPTGDCSNLSNSTGETNTDDPIPSDCTYKSATPTQLYLYPDTSYQVVTTLETGISYEVTASSPGGWYQIQFSNPSQLGWAQIQPAGACQSLPEQIFNCQFVGDTVVPIYVKPEIGSTQLGSLQAGDSYRFGSYGGEWTSGDVSGYWIEVFYSPQRAVPGYIQNTGGHLEGNCPTR